MSQRYRLLLLLSLLAVVIAIGAVLVSRDGGDPLQLRATTAKAVVSDYVDHAVLKTLERLVADLEKLHLAAEEVQAAQTADKLAATVQAWHAAHGSWKMTTTYLYGPAAQYDYHKQLATWPCEKVLIEHSLGMMAAGDLEVDSRYLREEQVASLRGFYTVQYLLFRGGKPREIVNISPVELSYLTAVTQAMHEEGIDFEAAWRGTENLAPMKMAILSEGGIKKRAGYADEFKNPGEPGSRYASLSTPLQEVFQEISGALEEMAAVIAELHVTAGSENPAYWDSIDPYADLEYLLRSIENAYLGGVEGARDRSISELVALHDKALDRLLKASLAHTAYRIEAVREMRDKPSQDRDLAIRIAEAELEKMMARFAIATPQVILDPAVEPYAAYLGLQQPPNSAR